jgi:hypothetical protein
LHQAHPNLEFFKTTWKTGNHDMIGILDKIKKNNLPLEWQALLDLKDFQSQVKKINLSLSF